MNKIRIVVVCLMIVGMYGITSVLATQNKADEMCVPMGSILLEPPESIQQKRSPVDFPHFRHLGYACQECHHKWTGNAQILNCTTSDCHDLRKSPKKTIKSRSEPNLAIRYYKTAFHNQCKGCHKEIKRKNKEMEKSYTVLKPKLLKAGPTGCVQCHPKQ